MTDANTTTIKKRRERVMCWKTYDLSRSEVEVIARFTDVHAQQERKVSAYHIPEQSETNFNGDRGGLNTHKLKKSCRRPQISEDAIRITPKELVSCH